MGKFVQQPEVELLNKYFDNYVDATERYSKYQQGSPYFVDYYQLDLSTSTSDQGLNNVAEVVGGESPLKYKKIKDFPIYLEGEVPFNQQLEEDSGFTPESEGTAIILPGTIIPNHDDLIVFKFLEKKFIYRVGDVDTSNTSMRTFYRVTFFISPFDISTLEERQVEEEYETIYQNIGTELDPVIPQREFTLINEIDEVLDYLCERYIRFYYDEKLNSFIYNKDKMNMAIHDFYKDNGIYDPKLAMFIKRNNLFINKKTFLKNIYIDVLLKNRDLDYERTIYSYLETFDSEEYKYPYFFFNAIKEGAFLLFKDKFHELVHNPIAIYDGIIIPDYMVKEGKFTNIDLVKYVEDESLLIDDLIDNKEKILVIYLRAFGNKEQNNILNHIEDMVNLSKTLKVNKEFDSYLLIPCIIFILKRIRERLMHKANYIR